MAAENQQQISSDDTIDVGQLLQTVVKNKRLIMICILLAVFVAALYLRMTRPVYSVDGLIQVEDKQDASNLLLGSFTNISGLASGLVGDKSPADTEIQLLKSRFVLGKVIQNLNLNILVSSDQDRWYRRLIHKHVQHIEYSNKGVGYSADGMTFQIQKFEIPDSLLGKTFELTFLPKGRFSLRLIRESEIEGFENQPLIMGTIGQLLSVTLVDGNQLQFAIQGSINNGLGSVELTKNTLLQSVKDVESKLLINEKGKDTGVIALAFQGTDRNLIVSTLNEIMQVYYEQNVARRTQDIESTLSFLHEQLPKSKQELEDSETKYDDFRKKNNTVDISKEAELLIAQSVDLKTKKIELEQQSAMLNQRYTSNFPLLGQINAQMASLDQEDKNLEARISAIPDLQHQYLQLYRDVEVNMALYTSLLNNYQQLKITRAGKIGNVRILDWALRSDLPIKPIKIMILLLSLILGGIVSMVLIILKSIVFSGVKDTSIIEARTGLSVLATVPRSIPQRDMFRRKQKVRLIAKEDSEDLAVESIRSLRTVVHFSATKAKNNIILFTGSSPEVGKSFLSANFAVVCAQMGKSVILIDGDMRRGHLKKYFSLMKVQGLADYLKNPSMDFEDVCQSTSVEGLDFVAKGNTPVNPAELLLGERFRVLMDDLSQKYDYVIIDSPPVLAATDGVVISRMAGMTLIVARYAQTHLRELELTLARLSQAGASVEGIVFNDVQSGNGYGYQYAYQYRAHK